MENTTSLFERLGGLKGIEAIVDDIVELHMNNPNVKSRFLPLKDNPEHFAEVRQHLISFLAFGSGGPVEYKGKDMTAAHKGMNISNGEYMNVVDDIMTALDKNNIDEQTKKDVLFIAYSLKATMVHV
ncbi:group I truncated hemoglobin [Flavobacterium daejeonense]|uniref:group I truncated hemoglobin n=1 Tax=Flavobacterium daejeonense TaxID=350893 RepID=UPI000479962D|nr:group 1 truncated hemoglobin [Flavobacterium daejeonense]